MEIICPPYIIKAIKLLEKSGFSAYAVGGCIRDVLMNNVPNDWDMTTSSTPDETLEVFKDYRSIPTGIKHGTVSVIIDSNTVEITTMRIDGSYNDNRRPDSVSYTRIIEKDLARRDFTINAIAYNPSTGIIDPFNGISDIENRIIRCVGNPDKRFSEDALRIIRAVRFASVLGYDIEKDTSLSLIKNKNLIINIAKERIRVELIKLLKGKNVEKVLIDYKDILFTIIPELKPLDGFEQHTHYHIYDIWTHTVKTVSNINNTKELRVSALLHDIGKPKMFKIDKNGVGHFKGHPAVSKAMAEEILQRLKFSNYDIKRICSIIEIHDLRPNGEKKQIVHWCSKYSTDTFANALELMKADLSAKNPEYNMQASKIYSLSDKYVHEIIENKLCLNVHDLSINGDDLIKIGFTGKKIGDVLNELLEYVLNEDIENKKDALIRKAESLL